MPKKSKNSGSPTADWLRLSPAQMRVFARLWASKGEWIVLRGHDLNAGIRLSRRNLADYQPRSGGLYGAVRLSHEGQQFPLVVEGR